MNSNFLNTSISFEFYDVSTNSLGTPTESWTFLKESYANVKFLNGGTLTGDGEQAYTSLEFTVRYDPDIDYKCRILYDSGVYKISHIYTTGRQDFTRIVAKVWED